MERRNFIKSVVGGAVAGAVGIPSFANAADKPSVIRFGFPGVGIGNRPFTGGSPSSLLHIQGRLENEFKPDGISIKWNFLRGAGPAVNELYANGLLDASTLGDLPFIVGIASGLKYRVLSTSSVRQNTYLIVPSDSSIQKIQEIKGKRVAIFKGTNTQLSVAQILESLSLSERDLKTINMDTATSRAAIVTKDVDAYFGGSDVLSLRDQGVARLIYSTRGDPRFLRHGTLLATEDFINKYPHIVQRIVNQQVQAAKFVSDNDKTPQTVYNLWTKSGVQFANYKEDFSGVPLSLTASPLIDPYVVSQYQQKVELAKKFNLIKRTFQFESIVDRRFLNNALKELKLEDYWKPVPASGKV